MEGRIETPVMNVCTGIATDTRALSNRLREHLGSRSEIRNGPRRPGDVERSVLDPNNRCWDAKGLYVTDGAAFPSQGAQNPTLTILALTARACTHAVRNRPL